MLQIMLMCLFSYLVSHSPAVLQNIQDCQRILVERGNLFLSKIKNSRQKIAKQAQQFIRDGTVRQSKDKLIYFSFR